jgi:anhydro-N-acetylmuramic acid kinase
LQIGDGHEIAIASGIKTICNFRSMDVALGGQGAPLVPIGDQFLFPAYNFCINIGGFANISFDDKGKRVAYDIGPANIVLNYLANKLGHPFDKNGALGFLGKSNDQLLSELNSLSYYSLKHPKSLGKEWFELAVLPILNRSNISIHNQLKTVYEHIAFQISKSIDSKKTTKTLITGGGAYNKLLINLIRQKTKSEIIIPDKEIIEYKEALIFALLGIMKLTNQINCLASVTGAGKDSSSGMIYNP